jgi:hypothetical protein
LVDYNFGLLRDASRVDYERFDYEVSTGSGSDRVSTYVAVEIARAMTRSLTLPVLTLCPRESPPKIRTLSSISHFTGYELGFTW